MLEILPQTAVLIPTTILSICRFENQRWIRKRAQGVRGASEAVGLFIDLTGIISLVFSFIFLVAYGYQFGALAAIVLFLIVAAIGMAYSMFSTFLYGDNFALQFIATFAIWPLMFWTATKVSWFGIS